MLGQQTWPLLYIVVSLAPLPIAGRTRLPMIRLAADLARALPPPPMFHVKHPPLSSAAPPGYNGGEPEPTPPRSCPGLVFQCRES